MRRISTICGISICLALAGSAGAGEPVRMIGGSCCPTPCITPVPAAPPATMQPGQPPQPGQQPQAPVTDAFAQAPEAGTEAAASFNPQMMGDILGYSAQRRIFISSSSTFSASSSGTSTVRVPLAGRGAFKMADNDSPRPQDRIFVTYNYFNNVNSSINPTGVPNFNVHYETIGFEKTLLDGDASFGLRVPFVQFDGSGGIRASDFGDLSFVFKYALVNDPCTGNVLSGGVVLTVPTGQDVTLVDGTKLDSWIIQPWAGYIYNMDDLYVHGFVSLPVPTDSKDVTLLFIDNALGYWLYRDNCGSGLTGIVPTLEAHVNIPLDNRGAFHSPVGFSDQVVLTGGVHLMTKRSTFTLGMSLPFTGPQPYDFEAFAQFNLRF